MFFPLTCQINQLDSRPVKEMVEEKEEEEKRTVKKRYTNGIAGEGDGGKSRRRRRERKTHCFETPCNDENRFLGQFKSV